MPTDVIELAGSRHAFPAHMRAIGRVPDDQAITISIYLKAREEGVGAAPSRTAIREARASSHADDFDAIAVFAENAKLQVIQRDAARRLMKLRGSARALERAFATQLHHYEAGDGAVYRSRDGALLVPADLAGRMLAVLGLDTTPIATAKIVPHRGKTPPTGFLPVEVARLYGFEGVNASGQCIGIIELGGGYADADNRAAFAAMRLPVPEIVAVGLDGAANSPADGSGADSEVALDIQVAGGIAPGARVAVYFAPNTSQGFADAISHAVHDDTNRPSAISISWGSAEDGWSTQAIAAMHQAFGDAAQLGVSVFAASGDGLATDGETDGKPHVDYPASDPLVVGCGGTRITAAKGRITREIVWNSNGGGTGGGVSDLFVKPAYQSKAHVPAPRNDAGGRGVPDVAGNADPDSGYRIVVQGQDDIVGGTSAVAPFWAGIAAGLNAERTTPLGQPHALLYAARAAFRDIRHGDNLSGDIGYAAAAGWDPCTGLGAPKGAVLRDAFKQDGKR